MPTYLPPSRTEAGEFDIARFNKLYAKVYSRFAPGTPDEESLCNEVIVALWHCRTFHAKAQVLGHQLKSLPKSEPNAALAAEHRTAQRQAKIQKNFAWRRRQKFFTMKTERENRERELQAAA